MAAPFALDAFEKYLRLAITSGGEIETYPRLGHGGTVILDVIRFHKGVTAEAKCFRVHAHNVVEVSAQDPRYRSTAGRSGTAAREE